MQQVLAYETDLLEYEDIFDQNPVIDQKVKKIIEQVKFRTEKIEKMGGTVAALDYMKRALVSSNSLLVPLQTEFFALEGVTQLMKTIERIKVNLNPELEIQGILLTMYDRRNKLSSQVEQEARDYFKEKVYQTVIPRNVRLLSLIHI